MACEMAAEHPALTIPHPAPVHSLAFRRAVYSNPRRLDAGLTPPARLAAILSLILWAGLIVTGRLIGFDA